MKADVHIIRIRPAQKDVERYYDPDERQAREDRARVRRMERRCQRSRKMVFLDGDGTGF